jgi:hypothetical protein
MLQPREFVVVVVLEIVGGWCLLSVLAALGLGPVLHGMHRLADRHETPQVARDRSVA